MINAIAAQTVKSVNVVASECPYCECDAWDCDWGLNGLFKAWNTGVYKTLVHGLSSSSYYPTIDDLRLGLVYQTATKNIIRLLS